MRLASLFVLVVGLSAVLASGDGRSAGCNATSESLLAAPGSSSLFVIRTDGSVTVLESSSGLLNERVYEQRYAAVDWEPLQIYAQVTVPRGYNGSKAHPLLLTSHGWSGNENAMKIYHAHALKHGYVVVSGRGWNDTALVGETAGEPSSNSWNGAGTTGSPGPWAYNNGSTCCGAAECVGSNDDHYCGKYYNASCACHKKENAVDYCTWTTCLDSVEQISRLLDAVEGALCVDRSQLVSTGYSNGGVFQFELARDERTAPRLPAFTVTAGAPHAGFNVGPAQPGRSLVVLAGLEDTTIPPLHTPPSDLPGASEDETSSLDTEFYGWFYSTLRNNSLLWAAANGCDAQTVSYEYLADNFTWTYSAALLADVDMNTVQVEYLKCTEWPHCAPVDGVVPRVIECLHNDGHYIPSWAPELFYDLFIKEYVLANGLLSDDDNYDGNEDGHGGRSSAWSWEAKLVTGLLGGLCLLLILVITVLVVRATGWSEGTPYQKHSVEDAAVVDAAVVKDGKLSRN